MTPSLIFDWSKNLSIFSMRWCRHRIKKNGHTPLFWVGGVKRYSIILYYIWWNLTKYLAGLILFEEHKQIMIDNGLRKGWFAMFWEKTFWSQKLKARLLRPLKESRHYCFACFEGGNYTRLGYVQYVPIIQTDIPACTNRPWYMHVPTHLDPVSPPPVLNPACFTTIFLSLL